MRYCGLYDQTQLGRITLRHYYLMIEAIKSKILDEQRSLHMLAWLNVQVKATKQKGKKTVPYYKTFDDFFKDPTQSTKKSARNEQISGDMKMMLLKANSS